MPKPTDIRILHADLETQRIEYRSPIKFGGRVVTDVVLADVTLHVETRDGRRGKGRGSMPLGNVWAWPSDKIAPPQSLEAMQRFAERVRTLVADYTGCGHPLDITHELASQYPAIADEIVGSLKLPEPMPKLAQMVAASPFEAAIHDAQGKALGANSYDLLGPEFVERDLSHYLTPEFVGEYLDQYTLRTPKEKMPLYHLVGALDPLVESDINQRLNDGLPETLGEWIVMDGLTHLKIKLNGDDLAWDVDRVAGVERVALEAQAAQGVQAWHYSLDFNEKCASVQYLLDFLARLKEQSPAALHRVHYIEQPTHRDLKKHPENKMHQAAAIKPVVIDESLVDLESLELAREQGYSGVALKACKGQTEALLMGAAAQKYKMFLCVQDLSCPGYSFLHSASIAARIPTIAAIEGNSRQYCPLGNRVWGERYPSMFHITDGTVGTGVLTGPGLGFRRWQRAIEPINMPDIFISYRRDDSAFESTVLHEVLRKSFGKRRVFMDVDGIPVGTDFSAHILKAIARSDICLAVISDSWLDAASADGQRRLDDPQDFVRQELEISLRTNLHVVPVLIGKADLPTPESLPPSLRFLPALQAIRVRPGGDLQKDLATLCQRLREIGESRDSAVGESRSIATRLTTSLSKCSWHPFFDSLVCFVVVSIWAPTWWQDNFPHFEGQPPEIQTLGGLFTVALMYCFLAGIVGGLAIYWAVHELLFCGLISLLRRWFPWPHWVPALAGGGCALAVLGILKSNLSVNLPAFYGSLWMGLILVQHYLDRARSRRSATQFTVGCALWEKLLAGAGAIAWYPPWWFCASLLHRGELSRVGTNDVVALVVIGGLIGSTYCTAAQAVRGTLDFNGRTTARSAAPSTTS